MSALNEIEKIIEQPGQKVIKQEIEQFNSQIKKYAQQFLKVITRDKENLQNYNKILQHEKMTIKQIKQASINSTYEWRTQIENRHMMLKIDYYREMVAATLKFQNQLNTLLNQVVELVYVYQDNKNNPVLYTLDQSKLQAALSYERNKEKVYGRFRENQNNFKSYLTELTKYELYEKFNLKFFNYTYKQVLWRYDYGFKRNKSIHLILWLNPESAGTKWLKAKVTNTGDLKEAYASVILDRKINERKLFNSSKLDNNVHSYMEEVQKVDSESGLLQGDVAINKIHYAIKGIKAQTIGISQVIELANKIMGAEKYTRKDLQLQKQQFHKKAQTRNHIQKMMNSQLKGWQKDLAKIIEAKNSKDMNFLIQFQPNDLNNILI